LRLSHFRANLVEAERLNALGTSVHGVTKFSDLSSAEFHQLYTGYRKGSSRAALGERPVVPVSLLCFSVVPHRALFCAES
jgi:hypothetical protein